MNSAYDKIAIFEKNMKHEINPEETKRAFAFEMWLNAPMPMVTLVKTMDVSRLARLSRKSGIKFNTLMCWCIGKAATETEELYLLPEGGKLFRYDQMAINVVVRNRKGGINSCDIPFSDNLQQFNRDYLELTTRVAEECQSSFLDGYMIVGTSAMIQTELDCVVNQYTDKFLNPMVMWGKYRKRWFKATLPVSFQFHHVQMDGGDAARFLERLQRKIATL
jgi:chloramphenicol O-acetyltransferase type A